MNQHFIHHSNTEGIVQSLNRLLAPQATGQRGMVALYGREGAGKSYLLDYWATRYWLQEQAKPEPRIIRIEINEHRLGSLKSRGGVYATAEACVAFSVMAEELAHLSARFDSESVWAQNAWYKRPQSLYRDNQFLSLAAFVRSELRRLRVACVIVDNAQHIDTYSLRKLLEIRALLHGQYALILCGSINASGEVNEAIQTRIAQSGAAEAFEQSIELETLTEEKFTSTILNTLLINLSARFDPTLSALQKAFMRKSFWFYTQGDWRIIAKKQRALAHALSTQQGQTKIITQEVYERVVGKIHDWPLSQ